MMEPIYAVLERGEKLNVYFELGDDFHGLDLGALWQDVKAAGSVGLKAPLFMAADGACHGQGLGQARRQRVRLVGSRRIAAIRAIGA